MLLSPHDLLLVPLNGYTSGRSVVQKPGKNIHTGLLLATDNRPPPWNEVLIVLIFIIVLVAVIWTPGAAAKGF